MIATMRTYENGEKRESSMMLANVYYLVMVLNI